MVTTDKSLTFLVSIGLFSGLVNAVNNCLNLSGLKLNVITPSPSSKIPSFITQGSTNSSVIPFL